MASAKRMQMQRSYVDTEELVLSREEIVDRLESGARIGCDAAEMIARWRAGALTDAGEVADLLILADLLGEDDPLFAG